jgi:hypothetical protein
MLYYNPRNPPVAVPPQRNITVPTIVDSRSQAAAAEWRVTLSVPSQISVGAVLSPLMETGNQMIFPFTPTVNLSHTANYTQITPTHTNYPFNAYQNSKVEAITISGNFVVENESDARYWIACLHFLRSMTKMFYGNGDNIGNPPLVSRLNGYGKHVLNNIPVLITNFTVDLKNDVDYVPCTVQGQVDYAPTQSTITVQCTPNYARRTHSKFDLVKFARGGFVGTNEGFV